MIQSIKLMSLPLQELKDRIQEEVEANPALEILEDRSTVSLESFDSQEGDLSQGDYFENSSDPGYSARSGSDDDSRRMFMEGAIARLETLQEHLLYQFRMQSIDELHRTTGERLIQNLDDDGFHKEDPSALCPGVDPVVLGEVMDMIRRLDPAGTCTSGYRESLLVQTSIAEDAPPGSAEIISEHLAALERGKDHEIRRKLGLTREQYEKALRFVKSLAPFPGRVYSVEEPRYVIPDLRVRTVEGEFVIVLNDVEIPVLGIDPFFDGFTSDSGGRPRDRATVSFVRESVNQARFFIRSIHQRNQTLLKVAREIVGRQKDFFVHGPKGLVPLTLRDVADAIGVHETTVSRIANSKYMQTDWGIYDLRRFFTNSISGTGSRGSSFSKNGVKEVIREIVAAETSALSDRDIMELLARRGIRIARRTVAKYRSELDLDSSFNRRHG